MKTIIAHKVKDGYLVKTTETTIKHCKDDVLGYIYQQGLKVRKQFSSDNKILAD